MSRESSKQQPLNRNKHSAICIHICIHRPIKVLLTHSFSILLGAWRLSQGTQGTRWCTPWTEWRSIAGRTSTHSLIYCRLFGNTTDPNLQGFGLWAEARVPGGSSSSTGRTCKLHVQSAVGVTRTVVTTTAPKKYVLKHLKKISQPLSATSLAYA